MPIIHEILHANRDYVQSRVEPEHHLPADPSRKVVVVTCMDARLDVYPALGLQLGEAHVLRNAGGVVTDDIIRSITLSQNVLGTRSILLMKHTKCGLMSATEEELRDRVGAATGSAPDFSLRAFGSLENELRKSKRAIEESPFIPHTEDVRMLVYDVDTGEITSIE